MRLDYIEEDIRNTLWQLRAAKERGDEREMCIQYGRINTILEYAQEQLTAEHGVRCSYDMHRNVVTDRWGHVLYDEIGKLEKEPLEPEDQLNEPDLPPDAVLDVLERGMRMVEEIISRVEDCCASGMNQDEARRYIAKLLDLDEDTVGEYVENYWVD